MSTSSSQPREWEILPLAGSTAEDFTANEPLPPQTTAKAKAARHFFSDKLLLSGSSAWLPTPAPAGEQLPACAFKSPWQHRPGAEGAATPCAPGWSTQTFPPSHSTARLSHSCLLPARGAQAVPRTPGHAQTSTHFLNPSCFPASSGHSSLKLLP